MPSAQQLRTRIEAHLADRIPSALTPQPRTSYPITPTGIREIDELLHGGFPVGAITEMVGPECSGRTSLTLSFVAGMTQANKVCAWVDISDTFHPESAAAMGLDLARLLWIRCGTSPETALSPLTQSGTSMAEKRPKLAPGLSHGVGMHPRMEAKGMSAAVSNLLGTAIPPLQPEPLLKSGSKPEQSKIQPTPFPRYSRPASRKKSWSRLEQGLRVADLLLHAGGFSCVVLDLGSLSAEYALRVPLTTWFRFRAAAERLQSHVLLLTQRACSKTSAGLVLRFAEASAPRDVATVFTGLEQQADLVRQRFVPDNLFPLRSTAGWDRKPPQRASSAQWRTNTAWSGER